MGFTYLHLIIFCLEAQVCSTAIWILIRSLVLCNCVCFVGGMISYNMSIGHSYVWIVCVCVCLLSFLECLWVLMNAPPPLLRFVSISTAAGRKNWIIIHRICHNFTFSLYLHPHTFLLLAAQFTCFCLLKRPFKLQQDQLQMQPHAVIYIVNAKVFMRIKAKCIYLLLVNH